jgi:hypothetical protein
MLAGVAALLVFKYAVVGLNHWDALLHPQRTEPSGSPFLKPLFGLFGQ